MAGRRKRGLAVGCEIAKDTGIEEGSICTLAGLDAILKRTSRGADRDHHCGKTCVFDKKLTLTIPGEVDGSINRSKAGFVAATATGTGYIILAKPANCYGAIGSNRHRTGVAFCHGGIINRSNRSGFFLGAKREHSGYGQCGE